MISALSEGPAGGGGALLALFRTCSSMRDAVLLHAPRIAVWGPGTAQTWGLLRRAMRVRPAAEHGAEGSHLHLAIDTRGGAPAALVQAVQEAKAAKEAWSCVAALTITVSC
jgi:hypothetical protein